MPEIVWAPWRLNYIEKPSTGTDSARDIFLELPQENEDEKNLILHRGKLSFIILNKYPYTNGHLLVAPYRQVAELESFTDDELLECQQLTALAVRVLKLAYKPNGFNIGVNLGSAAGAGIPMHLHWHIVPRWAGDANFMSVIGDARVMPQSLEDSYARLKEVLASL